MLNWKEQEKLTREAKLDAILILAFTIFTAYASSMLCIVKPVYYLTRNNCILLVSIAQRKKREKKSLKNVFGKLTSLVEHIVSNQTNHVFLKLILTL